MYTAQNCSDCNKTLISSTLVHGLMQRKSLQVCREKVVALYMNCHITTVFTRTPAASLTWKIDTSNAGQRRTSYQEVWQLAACWMVNHVLTLWARWSLQTSVSSLSLSSWDSISAISSWYTILSWYSILAIPSLGPLNSVYIGCGAQVATGSINLCRLHILFLPQSDTS